MKYIHVCTSVYMNAYISVYRNMRTVYACANACEQVSVDLNVYTTTPIYLYMSVERHMVRELIAYGCENMGNICETNPIPGYELSDFY